MSSCSPQDSLARSQGGSWNPFLKLRLLLSLCRIFKEPSLCSLLPFSGAWPRGHGCFGRDVRHRLWLRGCSLGGLRGPLFKGFRHQFQGCPVKTPRGGGIQSCGLFLNTGVLRAGQMQGRETYLKLRRPCCSPLLLVPLSAHKSTGRRSVALPTWDFKNVGALHSSKKSRATAGRNGTDPGKSGGLRQVERGAEIMSRTYLSETGIYWVFIEQYCSAYPWLYW